MAALSTPPLRGRKNPACNRPTGWRRERSLAHSSEPSAPSKNERPPPGEEKGALHIPQGEGSATAEGPRLRLRRELQTCAVTPLGRKSCSSGSSDRTPKTEPNLSATSARVAEAPD